MVWGTTALLVTLVVVVSESSFVDFSTRYNFKPLLSRINPNLMQYDKEYMQHIYSMMDAYRSGMGGRLMIETNSLINTKYRMWKRNADLINSLLALPKGLNDAGR